MKISKNDFKIIFNKMINASHEENSNLIKKISNGLKSGNDQIDQITSNYSSKYITKIMNKIIDKELISGQTSEETNNTNLANKLNSFLSLSESDSSIVPPKYINIINMVAGTKENQSSDSDDIFLKPQSGQSGDLLSPTSSNIDQIINTDSPTSSFNVLQNDTSATSSFAVPQNEHTISSTSNSHIENPLKVTNTKLTTRKVIDLVMEKEEHLKEKEKQLEVKEKQLEAKEKQLEAKEDSLNSREQEMRKTIEDLTKIKSELEASIEKQRQEKISLDDSLSELTLSLSETKSLTSSSNPKIKLDGGSETEFTNNILKKIFG